VNAWLFVQESNDVNVAVNTHPLLLHRIYSELTKISNTNITVQQYVEQLATALELLEVMHSNKPILIKFTIEKRALFLKEMEKASKNLNSILNVNDK